jgi:DNA-binding NarL/FixJ family response regulator
MLVSHRVDEYHDYVVVFKQKEYRMQNIDRKGPADKISIFLADRTTFFRQGVRTALEKHSDIEIVGESDVDERAFELIKSRSPQVVLIDITPPLHSGVSLVRQIGQELQGISTAVLTPYIDDDELALATTAGATAYFSRYVNDSELVAIIRQIADGALPIVDNLVSRPHVLKRVIRSFQELSAKGITTDATTAPITDRETEILSYAARGFGNKQIAYALKISEQTIKNHMTSILRKLDANDRTQAVVMAMQSGWIATSAGSERETNITN